MSPSQEVNAATGEAPEGMKDDALDVLNSKRESLESARKRYIIAKQMRDEQAMANQSRIIDALLAMIPELEQEASAARENQAREKARAWITNNRVAARSVAQRISAAQSVVQERLDALIVAIEAEGRIRSAISRQAFATELLTMRFDLSSSANAAKQPALQDWATPVLTAVDKMRPSKNTSRTLAVRNQASDTPEVLRHKRLDAVLKFVSHRAEMLARGKKQDDSLPPGVWDILSSVPAKTGQIAVPETKETGPTSAYQSDAVLIQAAAEIAALPRGVSAAHINTHRG